MPEERTYGEDEVAEIFQAAASTTRREAGSSALPAPKGFTLAELQAIGSEVGLAPERVAEAAAALDLRRGALRRTNLGMPVAVGRAVDLPRAPTDREWEMIVADLRETFRARGRVAERGDVREWHNGNLHAFVEPTPAGHRLRLGTTKGDATGLNQMGAVALVVALVWLVVLQVTGVVPESTFLPLIFAAMGGGSLAYNALRLPGWAQERETQMEEVATRALALLDAPPRDEPALRPRPVYIDVVGQ